MSETRREGREEAGEEDDQRDDGSDEESSPLQCCPLSLSRSLTHLSTLMLLTTTCAVHLSVPYASQVSQLERGAKELAKKRSRDPLCCRLLV